MRITESRLRSIIRSVIKESVSGVNRIPGDIDINDNDLKSLITSVNYIFDGVDYEDEEDIAELRDHLDSKRLGSYLSHLDSNDIDTLIKGQAEFENESKKFLSSTFMGTYEIRPEAFKLVGFSDSDITKIRNYESDNIRVLNKPDRFGDLIYFTIMSLT